MLLWRQLLQQQWSQQQQWQRQQHRWLQLQQWRVQLRRLQQPPQRGLDRLGQYTHRYVRAATAIEPCVSSLGACVVSGPVASEVLRVGVAATTLLVPAFVAGSGATSSTARLSFTLDSGASNCFFRDFTNLTPLHTPVTVALADPSVGSVVAESTTTLPCPAAPSGFLTGYYTPSFSRNPVGVSHLQDLRVVTTFPLHEPVASCTVSTTGAPLATFHRESGSGLLQSLAPLPRSPVPLCTPCVEGRQRAAPHSSSFPPTTAPLQTLHLDIWGPSPILGPRQERYFLIVVDDYSRYTTVFPLRRKADVPTVLELWLLARGGVQGLCGLRLHSDHGGEFSSTRLEMFCEVRGIIQSYTLPDSPQQNGVAEQRISLVMEVARTSMCHAGAPQFLWPEAVRYAAHQLNLWPSDAQPRVMPVFLWTGFLGVAAEYRAGCSTTQSPTSSLPLRTSLSMSRSVPTGVAPIEVLRPFPPHCSSPLSPPPVTPVAPPPSCPASSGVSHVTARSSPPQHLVPIVSGGAGVPGGVVGGGSGSRGAGAGDTSTAPPTPRTVRFLTQVQRLDRLEREERERFERARQQQQQQSQSEPPARLVCGPLPSPPVPPAQSLSSSHWTRRSPLSRAVSPEPRRSCYRADGLFHLVLRSRVPSPPVLPQPPESSLTVLHDPLSDYFRASRLVVSCVLSALVTHPTAPLSSVSALVTTIAGFASSHRLDYAAHLVSGPARSPSSGGAPVSLLEVLEDRQFELGCQLRLSYVASQANTADVFTKALGFGDHQCFCTALGLVPTLPHPLVA
ncbi:unnamed protein product [Closterium sp. NIES-54]